MCLHANQTKIWLTIMIDQSHSKLSLLNSVCKLSLLNSVCRHLSLLLLTSYHLLLADMDNHPHLFDNARVLVSVTYELPLVVPRTTSAKLLTSPTHSCDTVTLSYLISSGRLSMTLRNFQKRLPCRGLVKKSATMSPVARTVLNS
jgi:hypothetical protein